MPKKIVSKIKASVKLSKRFNFYFVLLVQALLILSCDGSCDEEQIQKTEWITKYVEVLSDTLVNYSIIENTTKYNSFEKEILHSVTIRNENRQFSNKFAIIATYGYFDVFAGISDIKSDTTIYSEIAARSAYTFSFKRQGGYNDNFNAAIKVLQLSKVISSVKRVDSLKIEIITVNSCEQNIEALKEKYQAIKKMFESKSLIATDNHKDSTVLK